MKGSRMEEENGRRCHLEEGMRKGEKARGKEVREGVRTRVIRE